MLKSFFLALDAASWAQRFIFEAPLPGTSWENCLQVNLRSLAGNPLLLLNETSDPI